MEPGVLCAGAEAGSCPSWHGQERASLISWSCPSGLLPRVSAAPSCRHGARRAGAPSLFVFFGRQTLQRPGRSATRALRTLK